MQYNNTAHRQQATGRQYSVGLWPELCRQMLVASARCVDLAPTGSSLALLPLDGLTTFMVTSASASNSVPNCSASLHAQGILSAKEQERLHSFPCSKRRLEWLGGRLAAKYALQQYCSSAWSGAHPFAQTSPALLSIDNDTHGRPFVDWHADNVSFCQQPPFLSISHSGQFAAAMLAPGPCGLDVQRIVAKLQRLQARFASAAELALGREYDELLWLAMLWAAKEAVKKCRYYDQPTFMERIEVQALVGSALEPQGAVLFCHLTDPVGLAAPSAATATTAVMTVRVAIIQGHALALAVEVGGA